MTAVADASSSEGTMHVVANVSFSVYSITVEAVLFLGGCTRTAVANVS